MVDDVKQHFSSKLLFQVFFSTTATTMEESVIDFYVDVNITHGDHGKEDEPNRGTDNRFMWVCVCVLCWRREAHRSQLGIALQLTLLSPQ